MRKVPEAQQVSALTDPIEGYYVQQKAPTARELLDRFQDDLSAAVFAPALVARVTAVLDEIERARALVGGDPYHSGNKILRLLNGEQP